MKWKNKCVGKLVHMLSVDGKPSGLFYDEKELHILVNEMGYKNIEISNARVILDGKKVAHNRHKWKLMR